MPAARRWIWSICSGRATATRASPWSKYPRCLFLIFNPGEEAFCALLVSLYPPRQREREGEKKWPNYVQWLLGNGDGLGIRGRWVGGWRGDTGVRQGCSELVRVVFVLFCEIFEARIHAHPASSGCFWMRMELVLRTQPLRLCVIERNIPGPPQHPVMLQGPGTRAKTRSFSHTHTRVHAGCRLRGPITVS